MAEADDIVQETYLRWQNADRGQIRVAEAWLVRTCTRLAIDALRTAKRQRVDYVGPWLPELVAVVEPEVELADTLSIAFLLVLERLSLAERTAFLLREVFDYDYSRIAEILGRRETACRQLVARGRRHARQERQRFAPPKEAGEELLDEFLSAIRTGELASLETLLSRDVEMWADGGSKVVSAMNVVHVTDHVARFLEGLWRKHWSRGRVEGATVGGLPGLIVTLSDRSHAAVGLEVDDDRLVRRILAVRNPDKLVGFSGRKGAADPDD